MTPESSPATTKEKIELGGLVIIAGLRKFDKDTVLGIMIDALEKYEQSPLDKQKRLTDLGRSRIIQRSREKKAAGPRIKPEIPKDNTLGELPAWRII